MRRYLEGGGGLTGIKDSDVPDAERHQLQSGDALVLYTDGLVERRGESLDAGLERLAAAVASGPATPSRSSTTSCRGCSLATSSCTTTSRRSCARMLRDESRAQHGATPHGGLADLDQDDRVHHERDREPDVQRLRLRSTSEPPPNGPAPVPTPNAPDRPASFPECIRIRNTRTTRDEHLDDVEDRGHRSTMVAACRSLAWSIARRISIASLRSVPSIASKSSSESLPGPAVELGVADLAVLGIACRFEVRQLTEFVLVLQLRPRELIIRPARPLAPQRRQDHRHDDQQDRQDQQELHG